MITVRFDWDYRRCQLIAPLPPARTLRLGLDGCHSQSNMVMNLILEIHSVVYAARNGLSSRILHYTVHVHSS
jgi:hypothetical protein